MEKKEIKKLELPYCNPNIGSYTSGASNIKIIDKVNEIIDHLNSQEEEVITGASLNKIAEREAEGRAKQMDFIHIENFVKEFNKRYKTKLRIVIE